MSKTPKFVPHYNRELGKKFYTERDYRESMKTAGVEPYQGEIKRPSPKPYMKSEWCRAMETDIRNRDGRPPGDRFIRELEKKGYSQESFERARRMANGR